MGCKSCWWLWRQFFVTLAFWCELHPAVSVHTPTAPNASGVFGLRSGFPWRPRHCRARRPLQATASPDASATELMVSDIMHVVYASDKNNLFGLLGSVRSLVHHLKTPERVAVHVIAPGKEKGMMERAVHACLMKSFLPGQRLPQVVFHESRLRVDPELLRANFLWPLPAQSFERLHLDEYLPGVSRIVYLDTDTILRVDIAELFRVPMWHTLAAARLLTSANELQEHRNGFRRVGIENLLRNLTPNTYFNSGVLMIDLKRWRREKRGRHLSAWLVRTRGFLGDQIALNLEFCGQFDTLDWRWNVMVGTNARQPFPEHCGALPLCVVHEAHILHWACTRTKPFHLPVGSTQSDVQYQHFEPYDLRRHCLASGDR